jgi:hypothetical protein
MQLSNYKIWALNITIYNKRTLKKYKILEETFPINLTTLIEA